MSFVEYCLVCSIPVDLDNCFQFIDQDGRTQYLHRICVNTYFSKKERQKPIDRWMKP